MTKKDKAIQELCDSLGGDYKILIWKPVFTEILEMGLMWR